MDSVYSISNNFDDLRKKSWMLYNRASDKHGHATVNVKNPDTKKPSNLQAVITDTRRLARGFSPRIPRYPMEMLRNCVDHVKPKAVQGTHHVMM